MGCDFWPKVDFSCGAASPLHGAQGPRGDALAAQLFGGGTEPDAQGVLGGIFV